MLTALTTALLAANIVAAEPVESDLAKGLLFHRAATFICEGYEWPADRIDLMARLYATEIGIVYDEDSVAYYDDRAQQLADAIVEEGGKDVLCREVAKARAANGL